MMYWLLFFAGLAVFLVGSFIDVRNSALYQYYGRREANKLWQDKYGFFDTKKHLFWMAVLIGAVTGISYVTNYPFAGALIFAIAGAIRLILALKIGSSLKDERANQIATLKALQEQAALGNTDPVNSTINKIIKGPGSEGAGPVIGRNGRVWYSNFAWLWMEGDHNQLQVYVIPLREKVIALAQRPEGEWFPK